MADWSETQQNSEKWSYAKQNIHPPLGIKAIVKFDKEFDNPIVISDTHNRAIVLSLEGAIIRLDKNFKFAWTLANCSWDQRQMEPSGILPIVSTSGSILVSRRSCVTLHDENNGNIIWKNCEPGSEYLEYGNRVASVQDEFAYISSTEGILRKVELKTGETIADLKSDWGFKSAGNYVCAYKGKRNNAVVYSIINLNDFSGKVDFVWPYPGRVNSRFICIGTNSYWADTQSIVCADLSTGCVLWSKSYLGDNNDPIDSNCIICTDGKIIYSKRKNMLVAYAAKTGDVLWKSKQMKSPAYDTLHTLIVSPSYLYCLRRDLKLEVFDKKSGESVWLSRKLKIDYPSYFPSIIGKSFYVSGSTALYIFEGQNKG